MLPTRPLATGSPPTPNTIGISEVASLAARLAPVPRGNDEVDLLPDEVRCEVLQLIRLVRATSLEPDVLALDPAKVPHRSNKPFNNGRTSFSQQSDPPNACRLLRAYGERRRERAEGNSADERSSIHWIATILRTCDQRYADRLPKQVIPERTSQRDLPRLLLPAIPAPASLLWWNRPANCRKKLRSWLCSALSATAARTSPVAIQGLDDPLERIALEDVMRSTGGDPALQRSATLAEPNPSTRARRAAVTCLN